MENPPKFARLPATIAQRGHRLSDGSTDVLLYIPDGEEVAPEHLRAVERALGEREASAGPEKIATRPGPEPNLIGYFGTGSGTTWR